MKIPIGEYILESSSYDFTVYIPSTAIPKDREISKLHTSYHPDLAQALNNVFKRRLLKSDATTLVDLLNELKSIRAELRALWTSLQLTENTPEGENM